MEKHIEFGQNKVLVEAESISAVPGGFILTGSNVRIQLPSTPRCYYRHGWQSWSLAAWTDLQPIPVQKPALLLPMQVDPLYAQHPSPNGSWLGAVDFADGNILFLGALGLDSHVQLRDGQLQGWYETVARDNIPRYETEWFAAYGPEAEVFSAYAQLLSQKLGTGRVKTPYRVWCSWYSLYTAIDEKTLHNIFEGLGNLPFDVLQVDDGWQISIGDWEANAKFPSGMDGLANKIKSTGRKAGLWLAPLLVVPSSKTYHEHPDWLLRDEQGKLISAGFNWGEALFALDTTHPAALDWLARLMKQVRTWGYDYLKLDFLYAGALPGKRYDNMPREAAYRHGLGVLREAMGEDAYFLTCGAPVLPSIGLCDALRIGPDVAAEWENQRDAILLYNPTTPGAKNAVRTTLNRLWLAPLCHIDPDVAYFRSVETKLTIEQNAMLQNLARVCNFKATSDLPQWLTDSERETLRDFLTCQPQVERTNRYTFRLDGREVDFGPAMPLPEPPRGIDALMGEITGWLGSQPFALKLLDKLGKSRLEKLATAQTSPLPQEKTV
jgi:alpha-galactosidase